MTLREESKCNYVYDDINEEEVNNNDNDEDDIEREKNHDNI